MRSLEGEALILHRSFKGIFQFEDAPAQHTRNLRFNIEPCPSKANVFVRWREEMCAVTRLFQRREYMCVNLLRLLASRTPNPSASGDDLRLDPLQVGCSCSSLKALKELLLQYNEIF